MIATLEVLAVIIVLYLIVVAYTYTDTDDRPSGDEDGWEIADAHGEAWAVKTEQGVPVQVRRLE